MSNVELSKAFEIGAVTNVNHLSPSAKRFHASTNVANARNCTKRTTARRRRFQPIASFVLGANHGTKEKKKEEEEEIKQVLVRFFSLRLHKIV